MALYYSIFHLHVVDIAKKEGPGERVPYGTHTQK
jgi:hypothetical protein